MGQDSEMNGSAPETEPLAASQAAWGVPGQPCLPGSAWR